MSNRRFWFVIDDGKLEYVQDLVNDEKINVSELEDLLNELVEENEQLKQEVFVYKKAFQQQVQRCTL